MNIVRVRSVIAVTLVSALTFMMIPAPLMASEAGRVSGRVIILDTHSAANNVTVVFVNPETKEEVLSTVTGDDGSFLFDAPVGSYIVLATTNSGTYLASESFAVSAGTNPAIVLTLDNTIQPLANLGQQGTGMATWAKWAIVGGIAVGAAVVIGSATDDDETSSSPF